MQASEVGLLPHEWWEMTPREFNLHVKGRLKAKERELEITQRLLAWHAANIINHRTPAFGEKRRKPVTVDQLLGKKKMQFASADEFRAYMRQRIEEAGRDI